MIASYTCESCFKEYDDEDEFVTCRGDACHEIVCRKCAVKCKDITCKDYVCVDCAGKEPMKHYCVKHAMWFEDNDGEWHNFDYAAKNLSHDEGYKYLKEKYP